MKRSRVVRLHYRCSHGSIKTQFSVRKTAGLDLTTSNYRKEKTHPNWSETATQIFSGWVNEWVKYMNACNFISDGSQKTNFTHIGLFLVFVPLCRRETSEVTDAPSMITIMWINRELCGFIQISSEYKHTHTNTMNYAHAGKTQGFINCLAKYKLCQKKRSNHPPEDRIKYLCACGPHKYSKKW